MTILLRVILIAASFFTMGFMIRKIKQAKVQIEDSIFWILFSILLLIFSIFPIVADFLAHLVGVYSTVNFLFAFVSFVLIVRVFMMTIRISQLHDKIQQLTQEIAITRNIEAEERQKKEELQRTEGAIDEDNTYD